MHCCLLVEDVRRTDVLVAIHAVLYMRVVRGRKLTTGYKTLKQQGGTMGSFYGRMIFPFLFFSFFFSFVNFPSQYFANNNKIPHSRFSSVIRGNSTNNTAWSFEINLVFENLIFNFLRVEIFAQTLLVAFLLLKCIFLWVHSVRLHGSRSMCFIGHKRLVIIAVELREISHPLVI